MAERSYKHQLPRDVGMGVEGRREVLKAAAKALKVRKLLMYCMHKRGKQRRPQVHGADASRMV